MLKNLIISLLKLKLSLLNFAGFYVHALVNELLYFAVF